MSPSAIERLHALQVYPIVLFVKFKSPKHIRFVGGIASLVRVALHAGVTFGRASEMRVFKRAYTCVRFNAFRPVSPRVNAFGSKRVRSHVACIRVNVLGCIRVRSHAFYDVSACVCERVRL